MLLVVLLCCQTWPTIIAGPYFLDGNTVGLLLLIEMAEFVVMMFFIEWWIKREAHANA